MSKDIDILVADTKDAEDIARLSYQVGKMHDDTLPDYFKPTPEEEHLRIIQNMLKDENAVIFKAVDGDKICGFMCLLIQEKSRNGYVHTKVAYIYNFGIDEVMRSHGIGGRMLQTAECFLQTKGVEAVELSVFMFNQRALAFYEKNGYRALEVNLQKILK